MHSHCKKMNPTLLLFFDRLKYYYFVCVLLLVARVTEIPNRVGVCSLCFVTNQVVFSLFLYLTKYYTNLAFSEIKKATTTAK